MRHEIEGTVICLRAMELADVQWYDNLPITSEYDDFGQQPLVVGDGEHPEIELLGRVFDPAAHEAQRVDIEPRIELVEYGDLGPQHGELKGLDPLLLTTG